MGYARATFTVLFRPLPQEVADGPGRVTALEGLVLMALVVVSLPRLVRIPMRTLRTAYVAYVVSYSAAFIFAFASIANFGILDRERCQLWPFFFVLLAIPVPPARPVHVRPFDRTVGRSGSAAGEAPAEPVSGAPYASVPREPAVHRGHDLTSDVLRERRQ